jgi:methyl-accepting chemotaxis protein
MNLLSDLPIKLRLTMLVGILALTGLVIGLLGISGMHDADESIDEMYHGNLHHTHLLGMIAEHNQELRTQLLLSLQHAPDNAFASMHQHPASLHTDLIREDINKIEGFWKEYLEAGVPPEARAAADAFTMQKEILVKEGYMPALGKLQAGEYRAANEILLKTINPAFTKALDATDELLSQENQEAEALFQSTDASYHRMITLVTASLLGGITLSILLAYFIITGITKGVKQVEVVANQLAEGDLRARVDYTSKDEIGHIASAFNRMAETFSHTINQVKDSISQLAAAAEETSVVNAQTTSGISQQQMETSQVATAINEMNATVHEVARNAVAAAQAAQEADTTFGEGKKVVGKIIDAIGELASEVEQSSLVIKELEQESESIGSVLDVIKSIAEQTNLLALNAAIEAARAGEQGRGFAVVADEVRTLAGRTQQSTREIEEMINRLQAGANKAVQAMESGKEKSQIGVEQAAAAGEALETINTAVDRITSMNTQIAGAAEEQSSVTEEINRNIVNINQVAEQTAVGAKQTAMASDDLANLAEQLKKLVERFKV